MFLPEFGDRMLLEIGRHIFVIFLEYLVFFFYMGLYYIDNIVYIIGYMHDADIILCDCAVGYHSIAHPIYEAGPVFTPE